MLISFGHFRVIPIYLLSQRESGFKITAFSLNLQVFFVKVYFFQAVNNEYNWKHVTSIVNNVMYYSSQRKQHAFVQNKSCLHVQKHKGGNATVCIDKRASFTFEQMCKRISKVQFMGNKNSSFQVLQHALNCQTFFTLSTPFKACSLLLYCLI